MQTLTLAQEKKVAKIRLRERAVKKDYQIFFINKIPYITINQKTQEVK
jgi:hypothetical protein